MSFNHLKRMLWPHGHLSQAESLLAIVEHPRPSVQEEAAGFPRGYSMA